MERDPGGPDVTEDDFLPGDWEPILPAAVDREHRGHFSRGTAQLWSLVLEARFIPSRIEIGDGGWQLLVPAPRHDDAQRELRLFVEENRHWPPPLPPIRPGLNNALTPLSILLLVATFHNITRLDLPLLGGHAIDWLEIGSGKAGRIMDGEWWRLVTALTLHADALHLSSNLAIGGIFIIYLCSDLGSGLAWSLLLTSSVLGNLANAYLQLRSHDSIGSSTLVFATVGVLGAANMVRYRRHALKRWHLPVAAALSLLVLLGTEGKNTDLGAHLFGFLFGLLFGWVTTWLVGVFGRPGRYLNALLGIASAALVVAAWWAALLSPQ